MRVNIKLENSNWCYIIKKKVDDDYNVMLLAYQNYAIGIVIACIHLNKMQK